jgi:hypothetical protein
MGQTANTAYPPAGQSGDTAYPPAGQSGDTAYPTAGQSGDTVYPSAGVARFLTQGTFISAGGQFPEMGAGSLPWSVPSNITALWYGQPVAQEGNGYLFDGIGSGSTQRGITLRFTNATTLEYGRRRSTGSYIAHTHTVPNVYAAGPRLYWMASYNTPATIPGTEDARVGAGDMLVEGDYTHDSVQHGSGSCDHALAMGARSSDAGTAVDSLKMARARGVVVARELTAGEWARAAVGDFSWAPAPGDPDYIFDSAADVAPGTALDSGAAFLDTSLVLRSGSVPPIAAA